MRVPRVGVGCVVRRGDEMLLVRRRGPHGAGEWSTPGGFVDFGEEPARAALREVAEETGIEAGEPHFLGVTNDLFEAEDRHSITLWYELAFVGGSLELSDEVESAGWYARGRLPEPLFLSFRNYLDGRLL